MSAITVRTAAPDDWPAIWSMLRDTVRAGTTYAIDRDIGEDAARAYWLETPARCCVARIEGRIVGTFYIRTNAGGGGAHVCNCGYVTDADARGRGVAESMCRASQDIARDLGYRAMQFNMVLTSNVGAVRLWHRLGFATVGTVPRVFDHPDLGLVDGHVMFRWLDGAD